jgi:hypothetical protein
VVLFCGLTWCRWVGVFVCVGEGAGVRGACALGGLRQDRGGGGYRGLPEAKTGSACPRLSTCPHHGGVLL